MDAGEAAALATQYCTAYYAAEEMVRLHEGDHVVVQAAAGGVGTALIQLAKHRKCIVYGGAGSDEKLDYLRKLGVDYPINYRKQDFHSAIRKIMNGRKPDVIFNSIGGKSTREGLNLLGTGGRMVCYGAAEAMDDDNKLLANLKIAWGFGLLFPPLLIMNTKSFIGINMLRVADDKPDVLQRCLQNVVKMHEQGILKPHTGAVFTADKLAEAHDFLESRKSIGKVIVKW
jgi:NADPH2:quinone reductase